MKGKIVAVFPICTVFITVLGTVAGFAARADDLGAAIYNGVNQLRQTCGVIGDDPRLTVAAQRHANDMLMNGIGGGHIGSDGSSPQARIADAGYTRTGYTGEIVYWGTGSACDSERSARLMDGKSSTSRDHLELRIHRSRLRNRLERQQDDRRR